MKASTTYMGLKKGPCLLSESTFTPNCHIASVCSLLSCTPKVAEASKKARSLGTHCSSADDAPVVGQSDSNIRVHWRSATDPDLVENSASLASGGHMMLACLPKLTNDKTLQLPQVLRFTTRGPTSLLGTPWQCTALSGG